MPYKYLIIIFILSTGALFSVRAQKLTVGGGLTGWATGLLVFVGAGYTGVAMMAAFFIMATAATAIKMQAKQQLGLAEKDKGRRTAGQVIANAGIAGTLGFLVWLFPQKTVVFQLMIASSLASATADTLSSEMGNAYGKKFFNILTFKKDVRGSNGVVSAQGSIMGVVGSAIIAIIFACGYGFNLPHLLIIIVAGTIGNLADSILGATLERKGFLHNNDVNFLNTLIGASSSLLLIYILMPGIS